MNKEEEKQLYKLLLEIIEEQKDKESDIAFMYSKTINKFRGTKELLQLLKECEERTKKKIYKDLLHIAEKGELEGLRREAEDYFKELEQ